MKNFGFFKENRTIFVVLGLLVGTGLVLSFDLCGLGTKDFGLNFLTEMLGVAVSVLIIDRIIKYRDKINSIPKTLCMYEEIRLFTSRYLSFWVGMFRCTVPEDDPATISEFFSDTGMSKISTFINLSSTAEVVPTRPCYLWITQNAQEFKGKGDKIIDRYLDIVDPNVIGYMHQIIDGTFNSLLLQIAGIFRTLGGVSNFLPPEKKDYDAILGLIDWCNKTYDLLEKNNPGILKVTQYVPKKITDKTNPPKCKK
ncbi:hypothetical protein FACS1894130_09200 [Spirochaetia bacterium]|nr:hypothetical protein FACS1894130_09200 [Spirochaetia bacterium]